MKIKSIEKDYKIASLSSASQGLKEEIEDLKTQLKHASKNVVNKEKEISRLQVKNENLTQSYKTLKNENKEIVTEKK